VRAVTSNEVLRGLARALLAGAANLDDETLPPDLRAMLNHCREDLAIILAPTEADTAAFLDSADPVVSFEALRELLRRH
jgi:hypothetical protein